MLCFRIVVWITESALLLVACATEDAEEAADEDQLIEVHLHWQNPDCSDVAASEHSGTPHRVLGIYHSVICTSLYGFSWLHSYASISQH